MGQRFSYGGQAVIEGVMMRGRNNLAVAVRRSDGIVLHEEKLQPWAQRYPILGVPLARGSVALIESLIMGVRALSFSASQFAEEEEADLTTKDMILTIGFCSLADRRALYSFAGLYGAAGTGTYQQQCTS